MSTPLTSNSFATPYERKPLAQEPRTSIEQFSRESLTKPECEKIQTVLRGWKEKCSFMLRHAEKHQDGKKVVKDLNQMCEATKVSLTEKWFDVVLVCRDTATSKIQGVALIYLNADNYVRVRDIVTNPDNVRGSINKSTEKKISGIGTALIAESSKICLKETRAGLYLTALKSAEGFYEKLGFEKVGDGEYPPNDLASWKISVLPHQS